MDTTFRALNEPIIKIERHYGVTARISRTHENSNVERPNHQSDYRSTCIKDENSPFLPLFGGEPTPFEGDGGKLMAAALGFISKLESG